jgi:hypothetical protein
MPTGPGVHIVGLLSESQLPAHARPLFAIVSTAVLLDWKLTGSEMLVLVELKVLGVNAWLVPISIERLGAGAIVTVAGTGKVTVWTGLLLLHPTSSAIEKIMERAVVNRQKPDLRMHPPRHHGRPCGEHASELMYPLKVSPV